MTWEEFWWPLLLRSIVSMLITAIFGTVIGFLVRHWLKTHADYILRMLGLTVKTVRSSAADAAASRATGEEVNARLKRLETVTEAWRKSVDDSLGQRARQELRFTQLEQRIGEKDD